MKLYDTMIDLLADARGKDRHIRFIDGEHDESTVGFSELWDRAIALLGSLQARGMQPGDELVIFSKSNENDEFVALRPASKRAYLVEPGRVRPGSLRDRRQAEAQSAVFPFFTWATAVPRRVFFLS